MQNTTNRLLDEIRDVKGLTSDYAVAKLLGLRPGAIGHYRQERSHMREDIVLIAAKMLGRIATPLLLQVAADRSKYPDVAKVLRDAAKTLDRRGR